jgi:hypothetical protein
MRGLLLLDTNVILIGPLEAGKTTVGRLLGEALAVPVIELDDLRWQYYAEIGYDHDHAEQLNREGGLQARITYWKPFEIHGVERLLQDYPAGCVLPLGAGNSVYEDPAHFERLQKMLAAYPYVILLLPSPDTDESLRILMERFRVSLPDCPPDIMSQLEQINRHFLEHPSNARLARYTVYTKDQSPEQTRDEILALLSPKLGAE